MCAFLHVRAGLDMHALVADLVPLVLAHLRWRVRDLAACCRVCKLWQRYATPLLYERIWLRDQTRLVRVFRALATYPYLALHVRILELRVFPFGMRAEDLEALEAQIVQALQRMKCLVELCWTRTGSLSDRVLLSMFDQMHHLRKLELTGNSRSWTPELLVERMPRSVRALSFLLPDQNVARHLPALARRADALESLQLLCMHSTVITDDILRSVAEHVPRLRRLSLVGCKHVHGPGVDALVTDALSDLSLESVALEPGVLTRLAPRFAALRQLTLTYPRHTQAVPAFWDEVGHVLDACMGLASFTLYAPGGSAPVLGGEDTDVDGEDATACPAMSTACIQRLCGSPSAHTLHTLRLHGLGVSLAQLFLLAHSPLQHTLCDLVVHLYEDDISALHASLSRLTSLTSLHILSHLRSKAELCEEDVWHLACARVVPLRLIGYRSRVWHVHSTPEGRVLVPWDRGADTYPEALLVVRS